MSTVVTAASVAFGLETPELIAVAAFGGGGLVAVVWGVFALRDAFEIWSHEPVDAAAVRHESGVVEVSGTAKRLDETVTAPYSDTDCLAYEYTRKERRDDVGDDDNSPDWRSVESGSDSVPFLIEDDTGRVPIDPRGADISTSDTDYSSSTRTKRLEGRLDAGETVHVFGHHHRNGTGELADEPVYVGDGGEVNFRIADTSGTRAVLRLFAKGAGAIVFGAVFGGVAAFVVTAA